MRGGGVISFTHVIHDAGAEHACVPAKIDEFMCTDFLFYYILVNCTLFFCLYFFCDVKGG